MSEENFEMVFRDGVSIYEADYPGFKPGTRVDREKGIICEYDQTVKLRDGTKIHIDVFRPEKEEECSPLIAWNPYGKHLPEHYKQENLPGTGVSDADTSEYTIFEAPDPAYWCPHGYAIIYPDPRGTWNSEGDLTFMTEQEAEDCCDLIKWAGTQNWSNGNVGMIGVSYLAWTQWRVAELNPPHLKAINPQEGVSDFYREFAYHGGIPADFPFALFNETMCYSKNRVEDLPRMIKEHPLFDDYWASKNADLSKIEVPAYVVASWSDHGLHNRGTLEAFKKMSSEHKWLRVHGRKKWEDFYYDEERQRQFFDKFLKGIDSEVEYWPKVKLEIREEYFVGNYRGEEEWPLARTQYKKLFLNSSNGKLSKNPIKEKAEARYNVDDLTDKTQNVKFEYQFDERTELTGHMKLKLWVEADGSDDMDLFVTIDKIDRAGNRVPFPTQVFSDDGPAAYGWLRVSHRELDEEKSTPYQPVHKHEREMKLEEGEIVPVEIEIWPSSTLFEQGQKLQITIQGSDIHVGAEWFDHYSHSPTANKGEHIIHTGGEYDSHLLVPVIPEK